MVNNRNQLANDPEEVQRIALDGKQASMWTALPGIVKSFNAAEMTVEVQPSIQASVQDQTGKITFVNLPLLIHVPIHFPSAGGFILTMPVTAGDEVLVVFASRCIDAWWQSGGVQKPIETRMHDLSDGFAIPGFFSQPRVVTSISSTAAQLRNTAGTTYVEISADGKIKLVSPSEIDVTGNLKVTGTISATGEVVAQSATLPVHLSIHTHTGVTVGSGSTGGPVG